MVLSPLGLAAFAIALAAPQQEVLRGRVLDAESLEPVRGARVSVPASTLDASTDSLGGFAVAAGDAGDSLVVSHPGYFTVRVPGGGVPSTMPPLRIEMVRRVMDADAPNVDRVREEAAALAARSGGFLWTRDAFQPFLTRTALPLRMLIYSGQAWPSPPGLAANCVVLRGADGCAGVWVDGEPTGVAPLSGVAPESVEAIVIVPPGAPSLALDESEGNGIVAVFLRPAGT